MGRNKGVRDAFRVVYEMERDYEMRKGYEAGDDDGFEEDEEEAVSRFDIEDKEHFIKAIKGVD